MSDRTEIIDLVNTIFNAVDSREWDAAKALFDDKITVDFASLKGGGQETITSAEFINGLREGLHDGKDTSFHLVGNYRVTVNQDAATVTLKGYAFNLNAPEFGGSLWEAWGAYEIPVRRTPTGWLATGMSFFASHTRGGSKATAGSLPKD